MEYIASEAVDYSVGKMISGTAGRIIGGVAGEVLTPTVAGNGSYSLDEQFRMGGKCYER